VSEKKLHVAPASFMNREEQSAAAPASRRAPGWVMFWSPKTKGGGTGNKNNLKISPFQSGTEVTPLSGRCAESNPPRGSRTWPAQAALRGGGWPGAAEAKDPFESGVPLPRGAAGSVALRRADRGKRGWSWVGGLCPSARPSCRRALFLRFVGLRWQGARWRAPAPDAARTNCPDVFCFLCLALCRICCCAVLCLCSCLSLSECLSSSASRSRCPPDHRPAAQGEQLRPAAPSIPARWTPPRVLSCPAAASCGARRSWQSRVLLRVRRWGQRPRAERPERSSVPPGRARRPERSGSARAGWLAERAARRPGSWSCPLLTDCHVPADRGAAQEGPGGLSEERGESPGVPSGRCWSQHRASLPC